MLSEQRPDLAIRTSDGSRLARRTAASAGRTRTTGGSGSTTSTSPRRRRRRASTRSSSTTCASRATATSRSSATPASTPSRCRGRSRPSSSTRGSGCTRSARASRWTCSGSRLRTTSASARFRAGSRATSTRSTRWSTPRTTTPASTTSPTRTRCPGQTVTHSLLDFQTALEGRKARLTPWLQDFSLGRTYTLGDVQRAGAGGALAARRTASCSGTPRGSTTAPRCSRLHERYAGMHSTGRCGIVSSVAMTRAIELRTGIPGPKSKEILERKGRVVADPLSVFLPVVIDRGERRHADRRRRQHLPRLHRRRRLPERRPLAPAGRGRGAGAAGALLAHRLHDRPVRGLRHAGRAPLRARAGAQAREGGVLQRWHGGRRERGQVRARVHRPAGGDRLRGRLPRPHAALADADLEDAPVQGGARAVRARGLPRALPERLPRTDRGRCAGGARARRS